MVQARVYIDTHKMIPTPRTHDEDAAELLTTTESTSEPTSEEDMLTFEEPSKRPDGTLSMRGVISMLNQIDAFMGILQKEGEKLNDETDRANIVKRMLYTCPAVNAFSNTHPAIFDIWTRVQTDPKVRSNLMDMITTRMRVDEDGSMTEAEKDQAVADVNERVLGSCMREPTRDDLKKAMREKRMEMKRARMKR